MATLKDEIKEEIKLAEHGEGGSVGIESQAFFKGKAYAFKKILELIEKTIG